MPSFATTSLVETLARRAHETPDRIAFGQWGDGRVSGRMTYAELDRRARAVAALLRASVAPAGRVLILHPPGFEYIVSFFGCLYAGVVAVPAYPPDPSRLDRTLPRLRAIVADAQAEAVLTSREALAIVPMVTKLAPELGALDWIASDTASLAGEALVAPQLGDVAFLQYTSGSTGTPKGVRVTHGNLIANAEALRVAHGYSADSRLVTWVPPYHDMGLIGNILQSVHTGFPCTLIAPAAFLMRPLRWLQCISTVKATASGGPNFAFDLCVSKISEEQKEKLDLSSWQLAYCGAEPVRAETAARFVKAFARCGIPEDAFAPCYGLAEATLIVSGTRPAGGSKLVDRIDEGRQRTLIGSGQQAGEDEIIVVEPESGQQLGDGEVGEIWVRGPSVADGYWNRPVETEATFAARTSDGRGPFLRTGDLGFLQAGELFVSGRLKEVMIVRGKKLHPSDLEGTVESVVWGTAAHRAGGVAIFSVEHDGEEQIVVGLEVERRRAERRRDDAPSFERRRGADRRSRPHAYKPGPQEAPAQHELVIAVRGALAAEHGIEAAGVLLLRPGSIPKTSSGKKQRLELRRRVLEHEDGNLLLAWWREGTLAARKVA